MKTIVLASSKGGSGKTTLTVHLAVAALQAGHTPLILDADPQGSSLAWYHAREADLPVVVQVDPSDVSRFAPGLNVDLCFVDTQPRASASLTKIVRLADFVLVPMRPTALDVATAPAVVEILATAGVPFAFVLNACPSVGREVAVARASLLVLGPVMETTIGDRIVFSRALAVGRAASEFPSPSPKPAFEIANLWDELVRRADLVSRSAAQA